MIDQAKQARAVTDGWLAQTLEAAGLMDGARSSALLMAGGADSLWARAVEGGVATDSEMVAAVAGQFRLKVADLAAADPRAALLVPESVARKHQVLALSADDRSIRVATADPRDLDADNSLRFLTGRDVEFLVAAPQAVLEKIDAVYSPERSIERLLGRLGPAAVETVVDDSPVEARDPILDGPVAKLVDAMICEAVRQGASDIHAEPEEHATWSATGWTGY